MKRKSIPKLFRKPVSEKKFERKILRRIHIESERQFLLSKLVQDEQGRYYLPAELTKEDLKRLKGIAKAVKKNKGLLTAWKAGIVGVIIVAVVGFNLFFKNRLVERTAENGLERIFNAAADIEGTEFSIIKGTIGFDRLTIADEDSPMRNLIELGRTRLDLDVGRALSRKIIFDEIACREIRFDTPRTVSGALPGAGPAEARDGGGETAGDKIGELAGQAGAFSLEVGRESAERLIAEYSESLTTPPLIEAAQERYTEMSLRWSGRAEEADETVDDLQARVTGILETDITTLDTAGEIEAYLSRLDSLKNRAEGARSEVEAAYRDFQSDFDYARESTAEIAAAIEKDIAFLEEAAGSFAADATGTAAAVAEPIIRERLGRVITYGEKIVRIYSRLAPGDRRGGGRFSDRGRRGTRVEFPSIRYPSFLIKYFDVSTGTEGEEGFTRLEIRDLTGEQDVWGKPTAAAFSTSPVFTAPGSDLLAGIIIDSRTGSRYLFDGTAAVDGVPLEIAGGLEAISISGMQAVSAMTFDLKLEPDLSGSGRLEAGLSDLNIDFISGGTIVGDALEAILADIDTVVIDASLGFREGIIENLAVTTNVDTLLADRIGSYLREQAELAAAEVEAAFRDYLSEELETNEALRGEIAEKGKQLLADIRGIEDLERAIEREKQALRDRARQEVEKQTGELEDKAREQLEGLGNQLNLPSF